MTNTDPFDQAMAGGKSFPFVDIGDKFVDGEILNKRIVIDANDPNKTIPVLDVLIDGATSSVWLSGGKYTAFKKAMNDASKKVIDVGDLLSMKFVSTEPASKAGYNPRKIYAAKIVTGTPTQTATPPADTAPFDPDPF